MNERCFLTISSGQGVAFFRDTLGILKKRRGDVHSLGHRYGTCPAREQDAIEFDSRHQDALLLRGSGAHIQQEV